MIDYTVGNTVPIRLKILKSAAAHDLTGASITVRLLDGNDVEISMTSDQVEIDDQSVDDEELSGLGWCQVTPTEEQSALFKTGRNLDLFADVEQSGSVFTARGVKVLTVHPRAVGGRP